MGILDAIPTDVLQSVADAAKDSPSVEIGTDKLKPKKSRASRKAMELANQAIRDGRPREIDQLITDLKLLRLLAISLHEEFLLVTASTEG